LKRTRYELVLDGVSVKTVREYKVAKRWKTKKTKQYEEAIGFKAPYDYFRVFKIVTSRTEIMT